MLLSEIIQTAEDNADKETWNLKDGTYTGTITEFKPVKNNTSLMLKIEVDDGTVFMNLSPVSRYKFKPLSNITEPFKYTEDIVGQQIEFDIKNNISKQGKKFSNITRVEYIE